MVTLLANLLSVFGLASTTYILFNIHTNIIDFTNSGYLLQSSYAQEDDEEEADASDDDAPDEDDRTDNNEQENDDEDNRETNSIELCCAWDGSLGDGELTYRIIEEEDGDDDEDDSDNDYNSVLKLKNAVIDAVKEWNTKIPTLKLVELSSEEEEEADIEVEFVEGGSGIIAGATMIRYDEDGFINKATITLPKAAFYVAYSSEIFAVQYNAQKLKEIAMHEMTHALGVGHANFDGDIVSERLNMEQQMVNISKCDIDAVLQVNHWKLVANEGTPYKPAESQVNC
ncbi:MAG TPA: matrixin family metalloprotease [Nitrososphaeraceae archaeon]